MRSRRALPFDAWPPADRAMWEALVADGDILDGRGPFAHLRPASRALRRHAYGFWLGFLAGSGVDLAAEAPADRMTEPRLRGYLASLEGLQPGTLARQIVNFSLVMKAAAPARDWAQLSAAAARLQRIEARRSRRRHPAAEISAAQLATLGAALIDEADSSDAGDAVARAVLARDGAAIAILSHLPLRIGNLAALEIGTSLTADDAGYSVRFEPESTKAGRAIEARLPPRAADALARYLAHRPTLAHPTRSGQALWLTRTGAPYPAYKFSERIATVTRQRLGVRISAHRFRICVATTIAEIAPEHAPIIRPLLGHATGAVADRASTRPPCDAPSRTTRRCSMATARLPSGRVSGTDTRATWRPRTVSMLPGSRRLAAPAGTRLRTKQARAADVNRRQRRDLRLSRRWDPVDD